MQPQSPLVRAPRDSEADRLFRSVLGSYDTIPSSPTEERDRYFEVYRKAIDQEIDLAGGKGDIESLLDLQERVQGLIRSHKEGAPQYTGPLRELVTKATQSIAWALSIPLDGGVSTTCRSVQPVDQDPLLAIVKRIRDGFELIDDITNPLAPRWTMLEERQQYRDGVIAEVQRDVGYDRVKKALRTLRRATKHPTQVVLGGGLGWSENICYLNAAVQFIRAVPGSIDQLRIIAQNDTTTAMIATRLLQILMRANSSREAVTVRTMLEFRDACMEAGWGQAAAVADQTRRGQQGDSTEFLRWLWDAVGLDKGPLMRHKTTTRPNPHGEGRVSSDKYEPIHEIATGVYGRKSEKPFSPTNLVTEALTDEVPEQQIYGRSDFVGKPAYVPQFIKRFDPATGDGKNDTPIDLSEPLCLEIAGKDDPAIYEPCAIIVHEGSSRKKGHYFTFIRHQDGWREYNDAHVGREPLLDLTHFNWSRSPRWIESNAVMVLWRQAGK